MNQRPPKEKQSEGANGDSKISLRQQVLRAALECSDAGLEKTFSSEDLLLAAWRRNPLAWGLRGHETEYPDSERLRAELDRASVKGGMVGLGYFERVRQRVYRLTPAGLVAAREVSGEDQGVKGRIDRSIANELTNIISHPVFREWLQNPEHPKYFRDAGHFWGVAPGTPPSVIRTRINHVDQTLESAGVLLQERDVEAISAQHGRKLFDRQDIERALEFHSVLKSRFRRDLATLKVTID